MTTMTRSRRLACIFIVFVDISFVAWGAMAALAPDHLLGPGGVPIVPAEYQGFTGQSWSELARTSPMAGAFMVVLFRVYGAYNVAFGLTAGAITLTAFRRGERWAWWAVLVGHSVTLLSAMRFDWTVNAIGPFEASEYLGLVLVCGALAMTAPFSATRRRSAGRSEVLASLLSK